MWLNSTKFSINIKWKENKFFFNLRYVVYICFKPLFNIISLNKIQHNNSAVPVKDSVLEENSSEPTKAFCGEYLHQIKVKLNFLPYKQTTTCDWETNSVHRHPHC